MKVRRNGLGVGAVLVSLLAGVMTTLSSAADLPTMKPEELRRLIETTDSSVVVLDAQPPSAFQMGHIKGAINFPWAENIEHPAALPRDKTLVVYCDCAHEEDSSDLAEQLMRKFGYRDVKVLEGGWSKWRDLGYPWEFQ